MGKYAGGIGQEQFSLLWLFEMVTAAALLLAALPQRNSFLTALVFAALTLWSFRAGSWPVRWSMFTWFGGSCVACVGLLSMELAFAQRQTVRQLHLEYLAFLGTILCVTGSGMGLSGLISLIAHLARRR